MGRFFNWRVLSLFYLWNFPNSSGLIWPPSFFSVYTYEIFELFWMGIKYKSNHVNDQKVTFCATVSLGFCANFIFHIFPDVIHTFLIKDTFFQQVFEQLVCASLSPLTFSFWIYCAYIGFLNDHLTLIPQTNSSRIKYTDAQ